MNTTKQAFLIIALLAVSPMNFSNTAPVRKAKQMPTMEDLALPYWELTDTNRDSLKGNISKRLEMLFTAIKNEWGIPRALIFHGQRGVGKTLSAQALAGELDGYFMHFDAGDLLDEGNCKSKIKSIFKHARDCIETHHNYIIIFVDNIHLLRKKGCQTHDMRELVNTLSGEIMKKSQNKKILIITATYEPGEEIHNFFTKEPFEAVEFTIPDKDSRFAILMHYFAQSSCFDKELHKPMLDHLATMTYDFTPRDLEELVEKAHGSLGQRNKNSKDMTKRKFTQEDFDFARGCTNTMKVKKPGEKGLDETAKDMGKYVVGSVVTGVFVNAILAYFGIGGGGNGGSGGNIGSPTGPFSV